MQTSPRPVTAIDESIRVLSHPYPGGLVPRFETVAVPRLPNTPLGATFKQNAATSVIEFFRIAPGSPLNATAIESGHILLAIDGQVPPSVMEANNLIQQSSASTVTLTYGVPCPPNCKMVAAPFDRRNPGVVLRATRDETMVVVSRVLANGGFAGSSLHVGDVVLAINGASVSKAYDAEQFLRRNSSALMVVYVLDLEAVRQRIAYELKAQFYRPIKLVRQSDKRLQVQVQKKDSPSKRKSSGSVVVVTCAYDFILDDLSYYLAEDSQSMRNDNDYVQYIEPFMKSFSAIIERQLLTLEEAVCCQAYEHAVSDIGFSTSHVVPLADTAHVADVPLADCVVTEESNRQVSP